MQACMQSKCTVKIKSGKISALIQSLFVLSIPPTWRRVIPMTLTTSLHLTPIVASGKDLIRGAKNLGPRLTLNPALCVNSFTEP